MSLLRSVLVHYATGGTDWTLTACSYNERLTSSLFRGGKADAYTVKGRTLAIAAVPGVKMNEVFASHLSVRGVAKYGDIVDYSKAPVLFDKAVKGLKLITRLPAEYFPTLRKDDMFNYALRNFGGVHHDYVTSCQDDADGDLLQLTNSGGAIPLHDGTHKAEMDQFITEYRDGELDMKEVDTNPNITNIISKSSSSWKLEYDENDDPLKRLTKIMIKDFGCEINTAVHTTEERTNITNIKSSIESNSRPLTFKRFVQAAELLGLNLKISLRNSNGDVACYDSETGYNYNNTIDEEIEDE
jgi:hypothetical protein